MSWLTDQDAPHFNIPDEYEFVDQKATPVDADRVLLEDSADGFVKKYAELGDLPGGGGSGVDVEDNGTPIATAATLNFTTNLTATDAGGGVVDIAASGGGGGGVGVASVIGGGGGNITTTSVTYVDLTGMTLTIAAAAGELLEIHFVCVSLNNANGMFHFFRANVGGNLIGPVSEMDGASGLAFTTPLLAHHTVVAGDISGGLVTCKIQWLRGGGTSSTVVNQTADDRLPFLVVRNYG